MLGAYKAVGSSSSQQNKALFQIFRKRNYVVFSVRLRSDPRPLYWSLTAQFTEEPSSNAGFTHAHMAAQLEP